MIRSRGDATRSLHSPRGGGEGNGAPPTCHLSGQGAADWPSGGRPVASGGGGTVGVGAGAGWGSGEGIGAGDSPSKLARSGYLPKRSSRLSRSVAASL